MIWSAEGVGFAMSAVRGVVEGKGRWVLKVWGRDWWFARGRRLGRQPSLVCRSRQGFAGGQSDLEHRLTSLAIAPHRIDRQSNAMHITPLSAVSCRMG